MFDIKNVAVLGAGTMGNGIAQVTAAAGYTVVMQDVYESSLEKGMQTIQKSLGKMVAKGKLSQADADSIVSRISTTTSLEDAARDADLVIEAVPEILELKKQIYKTLDEVCKPEAIFGMHFMNPVPVMKLVEIIRGLATTDEVYQIIERSFPENWAKYRFGARMCRGLFPIVFSRL